jgi:hypothetical protein
MNSDLLLKITDFDGTPVDPSTIECTIIGPVEGPSAAGDVVVTGVTPYQIETGYYVYSWEIDEDQLLGTYDVTWEYIVDGETKYEYQQVVVVESATTSLPSSNYTERLIQFREALEHHIGCAQSIPIYFEQAKPSRDNTTFKFTFKNWNQSPGVQIYKNENVVNSGVEVDYFNGSVTFDTHLLPQETINAEVFGFVARSRATDRAECINIDERVRYSPMN